MAQQSLPLDSLLIDAGTPPEQWLGVSRDVGTTAIILCFWETTVSLIKNERLLSGDQRRFLAMVLDHKVNGLVLLKLEST